MFTNIFNQDIESAQSVVEETTMEAEEEQEVDRDSLVPGTGSINGHDDASDPESDGEDVTEDDENMSNVVQGTTETILNKLEENLAQVPEIDESELLQVRILQWLKDQSQYPSVRWRSPGPSTLKGRTSSRC